VRHPRPFLSTLLIAAACASGCATLPPDAGMTYTPGPISDQWHIQWNDVLGTPARMTNRSLQDVYVSRDTPPAADTTARRAVLQVLRDNAEWFRLRPQVNDLVVVSSHAQDWLRVVKLQQRYRGVPVLGGHYEARVFPNGRVGSLEGRFDPGLEISVTPGLSESTADAMARALFVGGAVRTDVPFVNFDVTGVLTGPRGLVIIPSGSRMTLAWAIPVDPTPQERWRIFLDASTGAALGRQQLSGVWR
jgi:Zn-dependent metalloprotease